MENQHLNEREIIDKLPENDRLFFFKIQSRQNIVKTASSTPQAILVV